jgi:hypothetical protein
MEPIHRAELSVSSYYRRWFWIAFRWSHLVGAGLSGLISQYGPPIARALKLRDAEAAVSVYAWQVPLLVVVLAFLYRIFATPYWMHQEDEDKRDAERAEEQRKLAESKQLHAAIASERDRANSSLETALDDKESVLAAQRKRAEQEACLAELMLVGDRLRNWWPTGADQGKAWNKECEEWFGLVRSDIEQAFSVSHAKKLFALKTKLDPNGRFVDGKHQESHARVCAVMDELHDLFPIALTAK